MLGIINSDNARDYSDEEILLRSQAQPWLFSVLLDRYQDAFLRKATSVLHNQLDAEEVVQDTFTKIYLHAHTYEDRAEAKFSSWAYRILLNTAFTLYQKKVKEGQRFVSIDPEFEQFIADQAQSTTNRDRSDAVERVLARLPGHFAAVLRLHYLERWSHDAIARAGGEKVGTIKARVHRAKAAFRKAATPEEVGNLFDDR